MPRKPLDHESGHGSLIGGGKEVTREKRDEKPKGYLLEPLPVQWVDYSWENHKDTMIPKNIEIANIKINYPLTFKQV